MSKIIPLKGEFTRVRTSVRPDQFGFVEERSKDKITVRFKNNIVGIYNIADNDFERINVWWVNEVAATMTVDQLIEELEQTFNQVDFSGESPSTPPVSERPKQNIRDFVRDTLDKYPVIMSHLKD